MGIELPKNNENISRKFGGKSLYSLLVAYYAECAIYLIEAEESLWSILMLSKRFPVRRVEKRQQYVLVL